MRLLELSPRWVGLHNWSAPELFCIGVNFMCPHCRAVPLGVLFYPPIDPAGFMGRVFQWSKENTGLIFGPAVNVWDRASGDTFDSLTLTPSLDFGKYGHWHGHISNGQIA